MRFELTIYGKAQVKHGVLFGRHWGWFGFDRITPDRWNGNKTGFNLILCRASITYYRNDL